jgi:hypothetical protein
VGKQCFREGAEALKLGVISPAYDSSLCFSSALILKILQAPMLHTAFGCVKSSELHLTGISSQLVVTCFGHSVVEASDSASNSCSNCTKPTAEIHQQQLKNDFHSVASSPQVNYTN